MGLGSLGTLRARRLDAQPVVHLGDTGNGLDAVLGEPLHAPLHDRSLERHLAVLDAHLHLGRVDLRVRGEAIADLFLDALIGAPVVLRTEARVVAALSPEASLAARVAVTAAVAAAAPEAAGPLVFGGAVAARLLPVLEGTPLALATMPEIVEGTVLVLEARSEVSSEATRLALVRPVSTLRVATLATAILVVALVAFVRVPVRGQCHVSSC